MDSLPSDPQKTICQVLMKTGCNLCALQHHTTSSATAASLIYFLLLHTTVPTNALERPERHGTRVPATINTSADLLELLNIPPNKAMSSAAKPKLLSTVSLISASLALCICLLNSALDSSDSTPCCLSLINEAKSSVCCAYLPHNCTCQPHYRWIATFHARSDVERS